MPVDREFPHEAEFDDLPGLTEKAATALLAKHGIEVRVLKVDGVERGGLCDSRHDLVNVEIVKGKIARAYRG